MAFGVIFLRDTAGSPERARWLHLARSGSQSQRANWVILPARGASHIIRSVKSLTTEHTTLPWSRSLRRSENDCLNRSFEEHHKLAMIYLYIPDQIIEKNKSLVYTKNQYFQ